MDSPSHAYAGIVENLPDLLKFVQENCAEYDNVLFRGQAQDWPLLPKLARLRPRGDADVRDAEAKMLASLKARSLPYLDTVPQNDWDWLAIAQHCGMATRLLDWSTNPLAALWFAVERPAHKEKSTDKGRAELVQDGVIWAFPPMDDDHVTNPDLGSPFKTDRTRVFMPKHINRRIIAQHGWFTAHYIRKQDSSFVPLEKNARFKNVLMKLRIPATAFAGIRSELDRCGINAATLYGDLVGLCRDAEWKHTLLEDEVDD